MRRSVTWYLPVCTAVAIGVSALLGAGTDRDENIADQGKNRVEIEFTSHKSGSDEFVKVRISDIQFITKEMTFLRDDGSKITVLADDGFVRFQGAFNLSGEKIMIACPGGVLSKQGVDLSGLKINLRNLRGKK